MPRVRVTCESEAVLCRLPFDRRELEFIVEAMLREFDPACDYTATASLAKIRPACRKPEEAAALLPTPALAQNNSAALLELALVDDRRIEKLNRERLGLAGPTNILSFPADNPAVFLGWAALSPETARRESVLYGQDEREYTLRLLAHGLAHLLGHDHGPAMDDCAARLEAAGSAL